MMIPTVPVLMPVVHRFRLQSAMSCGRPVLFVEQSTSTSG